MAEDNYKGVFLEKVKVFINNLKQTEQGKIAAQIEMMQGGEFEIVHIKTLQKPIQELIIGKYRFLFFYRKRPDLFYRCFYQENTKNT